MPKNHRILITGATGFLGHHILAELLMQQQSCIAMVRPPIEDSRHRLLSLLEPLIPNHEVCRAHPRLVIIGAELPDRLKELKLHRFDQIIHCAGCLDMDESSATLLHTMNVEGTKKLCELCNDSGCHNFHYISTAYVAGKDRHLTEQPLPDRPPSDFHNPYEWTKAQAEACVWEWARTQGNIATLYRPSIIAGHSQTGRSTSFRGVYILARATQLLAQWMSDAHGFDRHHIPLRLKAGRHDTKNIVPVDYVARCITCAVMDQSHQGRIYNLTHPHPPTHNQIRLALERYFDISGSTFVNPDIELGTLSEAEQLFSDVSQPIRDYFKRDSSFQRSSAHELENSCRIRCPTVDEEMIIRWIDDAVSTNWGRRMRPLLNENRLCEEYFEHFLPRYVAQSQISQMTRLTTRVQFVIEGTHQYECTCHFVGGQLNGVVRGSNEQSEYGYRTHYSAFLDAIEGRRTPQSLFLSGDAHIQGNVEKGLKLAMILNEFTREFPFSRFKVSES